MRIPTVQEASISPEFGAEKIPFFNHFGGKLLPMKKTLLLCLVCLAAGVSGARAETFDLATYTPPADWVKDIKAGYFTSFTTTDKQKNGFCQIYVMQSVASQGSLKADFDSEWRRLVVDMFKATNPPQVTEPETDGGWQAMGGVTTFRLENTTSLVMLTTMSGHGRAVSIVALTNDQGFAGAIESFLGSVKMNPAPVAAANPPKETAKNPPPRQEAPPPVQAAPQPPAPAPARKGFQFTSCNFDDGWISTEQEDWVHVRKGDVVILIHHARPDIRDFNNLDESTAFVWNTLVAPRYRDKANLWVRRSWWEDGGPLDGKYFAESDLTSLETGQRVHVVLFKNGNYGRWIEFITPDKATFARMFSPVYEQNGTDWGKLAAMGNYNKFAVAASDLPGTWYSADGAGVQYYNAYTGNSAGMGFASSNTEITFQQNGTYKSVYKGVDNTLNGAGNRYYGATYQGNALVTNWEIKLTNRFKGATETFSAQFEAVKGGRILHLKRGEIEELHLAKVK